MNEDNIIVSFRVINSQFADNNFIEIEITKEFYSNKMESTNIKVRENGFGPMLSTFEKNIEWLTVITKFKDFYITAGCAPVLTIEDKMVIGETGIDILNETGKPVSVQMFDLALNAFQQGISSADKVCKSPNSYCTERATYDIETGILSLPSVEYEKSFFGFESRSYAKAKLKKVSEDIKTFVITEIE